MRKTLNILAFSIPEDQLPVFMMLCMSRIEGYSNSSSHKTIPLFHRSQKAVLFKQNEIICSFFAHNAIYAHHYDDEDLDSKIDEEAMEEMTYRWSRWLCITARDKEFSHFARECRFAKYQENRANGRNEKRIVAIEDSNSKALVATDNNEDIDWTKEFDADH
ncbi:hypothetical protein Tco_0088879 [Tanacetum coccineum]